MHKLILRAGILLLATTVAVTLRAQVVTVADQQTLRGIPGLSVVVESLSSAVESAGLHAADILTDVELRLRLAGINVLTPQESFKEPGKPYLYVNVNVVLLDQPLDAIYHLSVEVRQDVFLTREVSVAAKASTWNTGTLGMVGRTEIQKIRDTTKVMVDTFIKAYLSVNPKK
jgi:hypothetical protein